MCKLKKVLREGNFDPETLSNLDFSSSDIERLLDEAEAALNEDYLLIEETTPHNAMMRDKIQRAERRIEENKTIIENGEALLEMVVKYEELFSEDYED